MRNKQKGEIIKRELLKVISELDAKLVYFKYDYKCFGNIVAIITNKYGINNEFILDRGEIIINKKTFHPEHDFKHNYESSFLELNNETLLFIFAIAEVLKQDTIV